MRRSCVSCTRRSIYHLMLAFVFVTFLLFSSASPPISDTGAMPLFPPPPPPPTPTRPFGLVYVPSIGHIFPAMGLCIPTETRRENAQLVRVVDGDTIDVTVGGQTKRVRYIGIDTPEYYEPYYSEAKEFSRDLVQDKPLVLIKDVSETDKYGRLLRYVLARGVFVNFELVRQGYATAATYPPDVACSKTFLAAQQSAREERLGIWAPAPTATATATSTPVGGNLNTVYVKYSGSDEYVEIRNSSPSDQPMVGWRLVSVVGNQLYRFPSNFALVAGASVRVHSGPGAFQHWPTDLKWTSAYVWRNSGDKAELRDATEMAKSEDVRFVPFMYPQARTLTPAS